MSEMDRRVDARMPLALLRALRQLDTPPEPLPHEQLSSFFPARLGLSDVIDERIRHFRRLARVRRSVSEAEVTALLELIARRDDAGAVFAAAGDKLAHYHFRGPLRGFRRLTKRLPWTLRRRMALRALRAAHQAFLVANDVTVEPVPISIHATDVLTARAGTYGATCRLYSALTAGVLRLSGLAVRQIDHPECQRRGDARCIWKVEPEAAFESSFGIASDGSGSSV